MRAPRLLVLVQKPWFVKSPWDSYTKFFRDDPLATAEEQFLDWWTSLPLDSFTREHAIVRIFEIDLELERQDLIMRVSLRELEGGRP